jgi:hypothetical protein
MSIYTDDSAESHGLTLALGGTTLHLTKKRDFNGIGCNKVVGAGSPSAFYPLFM